MGGYAACVACWGRDADADGCMGNGGGPGTVDGEWKWAMECDEEAVKEGRTGAFDVLIGQRPGCWLMQSLFSDKNSDREL